MAHSGHPPQGGRRPDDRSTRLARGLTIASLAGVVVAAAWLGRFAVQDSGAFAVALFGVPLACAALALWAGRAAGTLGAAAAVAALGTVVLGWALLTGLGIGLVFAPSALLLLTAAAALLEAHRRRSAGHGG